MTVYLDLVVGLNFVVDMLLLAGTNHLAGYPPGLGRVALGAALGGIYGGACLLPGLRFLGNLLWRGVSLCLMSVIAFGMGPGTFRRGVLFAFLSMALGGIVLILGSSGPGYLLIAAAMVCAMCVLGFGTGGTHRRFSEVRLTYGEKIVELTALHDTGNSLRDPLSGEQVLVAGPEAARILLGLDREDLRNPAVTMVKSGIPGLRLIPYRAVGKSLGMLLCIRIPEARLNGRMASMLVAFAPDGLGEGHGEFDALIGGNV